MNAPLIDDKLIAQSAAFVQASREVSDSRDAQINALLAHCADAECFTCGEIICPHKCAFHFHHDGCPACAEHEALGSEQP